MEQQRVRKNAVTAVIQAVMTYSLVWCARTHSVHHGLITHAAPDDQPGGWTNKRALCGVRWDDGDWQPLGDREPGCIRCRNALRKRGIMK